MSVKALSLCCLLTLGLSAYAQTPEPATAAPSTPAATPAAPAAPAAPMPLSTPSITGPLSNQPPAMFNAGPFGNIAVNGIVTGMGLLQSNHLPGDNFDQAALSNGQVFIQKADGWFQFYVEAGAYNIPDLATPFLKTQDTITDLWGPVPIAFLKLQAGKNTSFEIGSLPTLIGAEYTFDFENMNIERGLLWNQETAISRGIQVNQTMGKLAASVSWNDGFYSNRYSWVSGSLAYTSGANALSFVAGGNLGQTRFEDFATPVQNNGSIYNVIYTFTKGSWIVQPYFQYTDVPTNVKVGVEKGASTTGGAILLSYAFKHGFSLPLRYEYITSSGSVATDTVNLLFGAGSNGTSFTATPTYQKGGFFVRGDIGFVHAGSYAPGYVFGNLGAKDNQLRAVAEVGFIFGDNIEKKGDEKK
jgi:Putative beta-barrel porin-2, OmpL-like. bbp2